MLAPENDTVYWRLMRFNYQVIRVSLFRLLGNPVTERPRAKEDQVRDLLAFITQNLWVTGGILDKTVHGC